MSTTPTNEDPSGKDGLGATQSQPGLKQARSNPSLPATPAKTHLKDDAPLKKDVMEIINTLADDGSKSKYLAGHISKSIMDDTFLVNAEQKVPDSTLAINCTDHNRPAVFFSQKLGSWRCFLCMMNQEGLVYVDKQYKHDMETYEAIKANTFRTVQENTPYMTLIQVWKSQIRNTLVQVRKEFNDWIDNFTHKFVRSLNKIETSKELIEFADQDRLLTIQVFQLQNRYKRILQIFEKISTAEPDKKLDTIQQYKKEMREIDAAVLAQDKNIKATATKVKKALRETVELDSLGLKVLQKYQKFLSHKVSLKLEAQRVNGTGPGPDEDDIGNLDMAAGSVATTVNYKASELTTRLETEKKIANSRQQLYHDLDGKSSVYFLKPKTSDIYLFNSQQNEFVGESLKWPTGTTAQTHPQQFTSCQLSNDHIYMIGGLQTTSDPRDFILLPYCRQIDENFRISEKAGMKAPRCSIPLALIRDRWILAIGGIIGRNKPCTLVAAYDTLTNNWFDCQSLTTPRFNCSAITLGQRYVYVMPGANQGAVRGTSLMIEYLDTGSSQEFNQGGDVNSVNYGYIMMRKNWESLEVKDQNFFKQQPSCGFSTQESGSNAKIMVFGGQGVNQFIFGQSDVNKGQVAMKPLRGTFKEKPGFCGGSDSVIKMFNQKLYAVDATQNQLHVFDTAMSTWTSKSLADYKVPL